MTSDTASARFGRLRRGWPVPGLVGTGALVGVAPGLAFGSVSLAVVAIGALVGPTSFIAATSLLVTAIPKAGWRLAEFPVPVLILPLFAAAFLLRSRVAGHGSRPSLQLGLILVTVAWLGFRMLVLLSDGASPSKLLALAAWHGLPLGLLLIGPHLGQVRGALGRLWTNGMEAGVFLACLFGLVQLVLGLERTAVPGITIAFGDSYDLKPLRFAGGTKIPSTYQNGNVLGVITGIFFLVCADRILRGTARRRDYILAAATTASCVLSGSRTVIAGVGIGLALLVVKSRLSSRTVRVVAIGSGLFFVILLLVPTFAQRYDLGQRNITAGRAEAWAEVIESASIHEFLLGSSVWLEPGYILSEGAVGIVQQTGLIGASLFGLVFWVSTGDPQVRRWRLVLVPLFISALVDSAYLVFPTLFVPIARMFAPLDLEPHPGRRVERLPGELGGREALAAVRRRRAVVVGSVLLVVLGGVAVAAGQEPVYRATAHILLRPTGLDPTRSIETELVILGSRPLRSAVRAKVGGDAKITTGVVGGSNMIELRAESSDPRRAAAVANAYAEAYIASRVERAREGNVQALRGLEAKVREMQAQIEQTEGTQRESLLEAEKAFRDRLRALDLDAALAPDAVDVIAPASVPTSAVRPKPLRTALQALVAGLVLGVALALLFEWLDDSVRDEEGISTLAPGLPVLGLVPIGRASKRRSKAEMSLPVLLSEDRDPAAAEAYRAIRTSVQFLVQAQQRRSLLVTSASAAEGKTTTAANLGLALAAAGERVVLVCCDLRRPRLHELFELDNDVGVTSVLARDVALPDALREVPGHAGLSLLTSGPLPPNPSELLSLPRAAELIYALRAAFDVVLIDSPPVLPVPEALVLSGYTDATILVCRSGVTTRGQLGRALELLNQVEAGLGGVVMNGVARRALLPGDEYAYAAPRRA